MAWNAQLLAAFGLTGNYYYAVLLALGLAAAAFLFGVLQSYARFNGRNGWGVLELGGPIVGSALVVLGGFYLVPIPLPFAVTVFVHGEGGIYDLLPKDSGEVVMELGLSTTTDPMGHFEFTIPGDRLRPQMDIGIATSGYEFAHYTVVPNSEHVVLALKKSH